MKSLKIILTLALFATLSSCNLDISWGQVTGNGNVVTEERPVYDGFERVRGSAGLDVYLTEGNENKIVVEADENLLEIIETDVTNGRLHITTRKSIGRAKSKKVHVTYTKLVQVGASSGADVIGNSVLRGEEITLESSSGADLEIEVDARDVYAETSSGADLKVSGKATSLRASASSGSDLKARNLEVLTCNADASSGADITVNVKERLDGEASCGGDIKYYGNPEAVSARDGYSGSIRKM